MSSVQGLGVFVHKNSEAEAQRSYAHAALNDKTERDYARNSFGHLIQSYFDCKTPKSWEHVI